MDIPRQVPPAYPEGRSSETWEEIAQGYSAQAARLEARRCLRCDLAQMEKEPSCQKTYR
jgi:NADPH-dependent glutamate synthase beta subunit-like oxidoreductase